MRKAVEILSSKNTVVTRVFTAISRELIVLKIKIQLLKFQVRCKRPKVQSAHFGSAFHLEINAL